jgi:hypothetical protein
MNHPVSPWLHDRPWRNNNPGDLRPRHEAPAWPGQSGIDDGPGGPFSVFVTPVDGWAALGLWCLDARYLRGLRSATAMIAVFAPPSENDTASYAASVEAKCGSGDLDLSQSAVLMPLCRAIAHYEDWRAPWSDTVVEAGIVLAELRWPNFRADRLAPPADDNAATDALNNAEAAKIGLA